MTEISRLEERIQELEKELRLVHRKLRSYDISRYDLIRGAVMEILNGQSMNITFDLNRCNFPSSYPPTDEYKGLDQDRARTRGSYKSKNPTAHHTIAEDESENSNYSDEEGTRKRRRKRKPCADADTHLHGPTHNHEKRQSKNEGCIVEIREGEVGVLLEPNDDSSGESVRNVRSKRRKFGKDRFEGPGGEHQCEFCPSSFRFQYALTRHQRKHTKERPFMCEICVPPVTFSQTSSLYKHYRNNHPGEEIPRKVG